MDASGGGDDDDTQSRRDCWNCRKVVPGVKFCTRCRQATYCGVACQRAHWKEHKAECAPLDAPNASVVRRLIRALTDDAMGERAALRAACELVRDAVRRERGTACGIVVDDLRRYQIVLCYEGAADDAAVARCLAGQLLLQALREAKEADARRPIACCLGRVFVQVRERGDVAAHLDRVDAVLVFSIGARCSGAAERGEGHLQHVGIDSTFIPDDRELVRILLGRPSERGLGPARIVAAPRPRASEENEP